MVVISFKTMTPTHPKFLSFCFVQRQKICCHSKDVTYSTVIAPQTQQEPGAADLTSMEAITPTKVL